MILRQKTNTRWFKIWLEFVHIKKIQTFIKLNFIVWGCIQVLLNLKQREYTSLSLNNVQRRLESALLMTECQSLAMLYLRYTLVQKKNDLARFWLSTYSLWRLFKSFCSALLPKFDIPHVCDRTWVSVIHPQPLQIWIKGLYLKSLLQIDEAWDTLVDRENEKW